MNVELLGERLARLQARIAAAGRPDVRIIGVTKGHPPAVLAAAAEVGLSDVGESYAQELAGKAETITTGGLTCHFIGQLQTNKVRSLTGIVDVYQSVDRPSLVRELAKRAPGARALIQVDLAGVPGEGGVARGGCSFDEVPGLVGLAVDAGLRVEGLMGVAPPPSPDDPAAARRVFDRLAALGGDLGLAELSIGMSDDLDDALAAGSTMVRVGTALFGPREV